MNLMDVSEIHSNFDVDRVKLGITKYYFNQHHKRKYELSDKECIWLIDQLYKIYHVRGFGLKTMARCFGVSYTKMRGIFKRFNIDIRCGNSIVTERVKEHRRVRGKTERNFFSNGLPNQCHSSRGVQGYYFSKHNKKFIWLRSSYEYIYAKWLDKEHIDYGVEDKKFSLSGTPYTPDFFIYDCGKLSSVVEIKGYWKDKSWKVDSLNEQLKIDVSLIEKIEPYVESGNTKQKELRKWKKERLLKLPDQQKE